MKRFTILFLLLFSSLNFFAQDLIIRKNGTQIDCKVTSVDSLNVNFDFTKNEKVISTNLPMNDVANIIYEDQVYDFFSDSVLVEKVFGGYHFYYKNKRININHLAYTVESNRSAFKEAQKAQSTNLFSSILGFTGGFLVGWPVGTLISGNDPNWTIAAIGAGLIVLSIPISHEANIQAKSAVDIYNNGLATSSYWDKHELNFTISENGVGLTLNF